VIPNHASAQVLSVSIAATFTVLEGQVSSLTWQFIENAYAAVSTQLLLSSSCCAGSIRTSCSLADHAAHSVKQAHGTRQNMRRWQSS